MAHVDIPRLREGKNGGAFWSAFVPCPKNGSDFSDENYAECTFFPTTKSLLIPMPFRSHLISSFPLLTLT